MANNQENRFNFNPLVWGPKGWFFLDTIILAYPNNPNDEQKKNYAEFFYSLSNILPCQKCLNNYKHHLKIEPLTDDNLSSRKKLVEWWLKIHNLSRLDLNKDLIKYDDFLKYYNNEYRNRDNNIWMIKNMVYLSLFILIIIMFKDLFFKKKL
jgi:hypothetical protein